MLLPYEIMLVFAELWPLLYIYSGADPLDKPILKINRDTAEGECTDMAEGEYSSSMFMDQTRLVLHKSYILSLVLKFKFSFFCIFLSDRRIRTCHTIKFKYSPVCLMS